MQVAELAVDHPLSKSLTIHYQPPVTAFRQDNTTYFQPMLQSFKFA